MISIFDLDDDSLIKIFEFLTIYELIEVEKVCKFFKEICYEVYCTKKFHKVEIELRHLKTEYFKAILGRIGGTMRTFRFSGGYIMDENVIRDLIEGLTNSCTKLRNLTINYVQFRNTDFIQLQSCFENLASLDLSHCSISEDTIGTTLDGEKFKSIKTLKLAGNSSMTGAFFQSMKHVESLDVSFCFNLRIFEFLKFLTNCIKLVELNASASCQLVTEEENFLNILYTYQPNIERLLMDKTGLARDDEMLSKFKNLKYSSFEGRRLGT